MIIFLLTLSSFLAIYIINKNRKKIANISKLIDRPDKIRKLHKKSTPLLGGIMIFSSTLLTSLYLFFFQESTCELATIRYNEGNFDEDHFESMLKSNSGLAVEVGKRRLNND